MDRCPWAKTALYVQYHDTEWSVPVCCCPNVIHVEVDEGGEVRVWAERE